MLIRSRCPVADLQQRADDNDAEDVTVFRAFLTGEAGEREDEEDGGDDVGRCDDSVVHGGALN